MRRDQAGRLTTRNSNRINSISYVPYARMVGHKFDVSAYCQQPLLDALDQLLSIQHVLRVLLFPAIQITIRSLFIQDRNVTIRVLLSNLYIHERTLTPNSSREDKFHETKRSLLERFMHFFIIGLPLAMTLGFYYGIVNLAKSFVNNIISMFNMIYGLYTMYQQDMKFYRDNPKFLPPRRISMDDVVRDGLSYYTQGFVHKKFGRFSILLKPILKSVESCLCYFIVAICRPLNRIQLNYGD